jgi:gamma-glutamyltranspeptidase / glutathione hydrolase
MMPAVWLAPFSTRYAKEAVVCTVDALAAEAGLASLRAGGCAVDAAIAACGVLAVTHQHQCGLGGDLLALVHRDGEELPAALNASGRAGSGADPQRLRAAGHDRVPVTGDVAAVSVPGCVDGWLALHERFGRLPLAELLEPARRHAEEGFAASPSLAAAAALLEGVPGGEDYTAAGPLQPGQVVRRPGVARMLDSIATAGRAGFYGGEFGRALVELGGGEYADADLARVQAEWLAPLGLEAFGRHLWSLPPNSQGYQLLRSAALATELDLPDPEDPEWAERLIEVSLASTDDRDAVWYDGSDGPSLIAPDVITGLRAQDSAPVSLPGDTVSLCVVDSERMAVSLLQSNFMGWGSMLFLPGLGIALHNRGACFSLRPGHPAEYGPGLRPPHTLAPALATSAGGVFDAALATRGGLIQPQVLLQLLARVYRASQTPAQAVAAGRWALEEDRVLVEGNAPQRWADGLTLRGRKVVQRDAFAEEFGHAQLILRRGEHLAAASDPRSPTWATAVL